MTWTENIYLEQKIKEETEKIAEDIKNYIGECFDEVK